MFGAMSMSYPTVFDGSKDHNFVSRVDVLLLVGNALQQYNGGPEGHDLLCLPGKHLLRESKGV
jgi:hypothetical protein